MAAIGVIPAQSGMDVRSLGPRPDGLPARELPGKLVRRLAHRRPFLSGVRASDNPGAVQSERQSWSTRDLRHSNFSAGLVKEETPKGISSLLAPLCVARSIADNT